MDVVDACDMLTFIVYTADDKELQRGRELQLSKARSHAAQRSYAWRKPSQTQKQGPHEEDEHLAVRNPPHHKSRQHSLTTGRRSLKRSVDWHFGSLGSSCRPVGDLDVTALQFYLRQPLAQTMSAEIVNRYHRASVKLGQWSSFLQETIQRVTRDSIALDSLVSSTVILMADNYMDNRSLISAGRKMTGHAVSGLRKSIQENYAVDVLSIQLSSMHLCLGALRAGDITASGTHLKFLEATVTELDTHIPYHVDLLSIVRFCDVWLALESGRAPSLVLHPQPKQEDETQLNSLESQTSCVNDHPARPEDSRAHNHAFSLDPAIPDQRSHSGLIQAATSGLLRTVTPEIIAKYANAVDFVSESARKETATLDDFQPLVANCIESLCQLCFAFDQTQHDTHSAGTPLDNNQSSPFQLSAARSTDLDEPVALALQMQIVIRLGKFIQRNRETLSHRLINALSRRPHLVGWTMAEKSAGGASAAIQNRLYLWVLVSGMLCAQNDLKELGWYRSRIMQALAAMDVTTEAQLNDALEPFLTVHAPFDFGFRKLAQNLVGASARKLVEFAETRRRIDQVKERI